MSPLSTALALLLAAGGGGAPPPSGVAAGAPGPRAEAPKALRDELAGIVARTPLAGARLGILVESLDTGEELYALSPDELFNPASNVKLFTAAAALANLGPDYRFETEFLLAAGRGGAPNLHVRGKGDPTLVTERLWAIAGELADLGPERLGDIVLDDSWFDEERFAPGYDQESGDRAYLAPAGALSLNFNTVAVQVTPGNARGTPGRVRLEPPSDFFVLENHTVTAASRALRRVAVTSRPAGARQLVTADGKLPLGGRRQVFYRRIDDPPVYLGETLKKLLGLRGVKVRGRVRRGDVPEGANLLYVSQSDSLGEVVRLLEKHSNNFMAEQILKALGAEVAGPPGTSAKGIAAVEEFLESAGIPRGAYLMKNGSGLNDANRFSARQTVRLLREMWRRFPLMVEFVGALPVAGRDGTIRWRMEGTPAAGHLRAKTGTLDGVTSLSGYVETQDGEHLAFAILVNDKPAGTETLHAVDALGAALAAAGTHPPPAAAPAPTGDPGARVGAYYRIAEAHDSRNLSFLLTALRTEDDPVLRMAAAEAAYLSDPDGEHARRAFLEALVLDPAALERLRRLAPESVSAPVVGSLAALAAEGVAEALVALADLSAAGMSRELSSTWNEVAATAPEETLALLLSVPDRQADAVLSSLAEGMRRERISNHPFLAAARRTAQSDEASATRARELEESLGARLSAGGEAGAVPNASTSAGTPAPVPARAPSGG